MPGTDINKYILDQGREQSDPFGYGAELEPWDKELAAARAAEHGIELTDDHWAVIDFLRRHYLKEGPPKSARHLGEALDKEFSGLGGSRFLYQILPGGPVTVGCHLAGLPAPAYATDRSFGSAQ